MKGYGDITPVTMPERIYVMLITISACGVFAYAVNTIGQIFQNIQKNREEFM